MSCPAPETIHPSLWRASQLARGTGRALVAGDEALSQELPGGGWPLGTLVELLVQQPGVGELRLLRPSLLALGKRPIALLAPPHIPQTLAWDNWGISPERLLWLQPKRIADLLWAAEQLLRAGTCGAVLCWQQHVRGESLRRLHLAAQASESLFCLVRPLACARDSSPAPLRIAIAPAPGGVDLTFIKRRGPQRESPLRLALSPSPILLSRHAAPLDLPTPAVAVPRSVPAELVS
ncbi:translesion DNA synthesis-associated protein ImuA [Cupriavidus sp. AU9028]|uniref:translesion DNA synthesis-associated protein ImuA n=1 Tax=Cupriavidus sp. AU9028 TaxID=2871157 RepID=UPI001C95847C|nr:translesion DNA synthesis-associated protein ImuA [Cupriavidus sp. AU9028]MBY4898711.1 translesion DNA synthesis-associated protein ImuA [Cupriavidus sp. AU9028]